MSPVTANDIAVRLGVPRPTVSTILSGARSNTRVSAQLRERVLRTARELGYRPNAAAKAVGRGRFNAVGILSATDAGRGGMPWATLFALQSQASSHDMLLSMGMVPDEDLTDPAGLPKVLREWCVDGLVISYTAQLPPLMVEHLRRHRIPAVWMNVKLGADCVYLDDLGAGRGATEALLELGHRRVAYLADAPRSHHYSTADRFEGYTAAMSRAGLAPSPWFRGIPRWEDQPSPQQHVQPLIELLRRPDRPTAIVTVGREADLLFAAQAAGLAVPRDLAFISITEGVAEVLGVRPTQMRLHTFGLGYRAFAALERKLRQPHQPIEPIAVYCAFDRGQTLAPPLP